MAATDRLFDRGTRLGERRSRDIGEDVRNKRMELGLSQLEVAKGARISRSTYSRIERGKCPGLTLIVAARVASVLGLDLVVRTYPGGEALRDAASAKLIKHVCENVARPLRWRTEVPLPRRADYPEQRRWDLLLTGSGRRSALEFETRLYDAQAQHGRWSLKMRDDPTDSFVVVIADTRRNRQVLAQFESLFVDLPRMGPATFLRLLQAGEHPPTGLVLLTHVQPQHNPDKTPPPDAPPPANSRARASDPAQD